MNVGSHGLSAAQYDALPQEECWPAADCRCKKLRAGGVEVTVYPQIDMERERVVLEVWDASWDDYVATPAPELPDHAWRSLDLGALRILVFRPRSGALWKTPYYDPALDPVVRREEEED